MTGTTLRTTLHRGIAASFASLLLGLLAMPMAQAQLSLFATVDLARRNSASVRIAQADVLRAQAGYSEARDVYVPAFAGGSNIGYSYGFPVGQPTIFNFQAQSLILSFSQPDYVRSARAAVHAATLSLQDALDQVELDTTLDYLQLDTLTQELAALDEQKSYSARLQSIEQARVSAGVESEILATKAELNGAQADLRRLDLLSQAALLRERLGHLTGLSPEDIQPEPHTVPGMPANVINPLPKRTAGVDAAYSNAASKHYVAHGDERVQYRPQLGFGFDYQLFDTSINNYNEYYLRPLQANNFSVGAQLTIPLYDTMKAAHARGSAAEAVHADGQAEQAREQADEAVVQLEKSLATLRAQSRVADLQAQLASQQLQSVLIQLRQPPASPAAAPLTPADEMQARIEERARYSDALDARFSFIKAELSLLRATGGLAAWINTAAH